MTNENDKPQRRNWVAKHAKDFNTAHPLRDKTQYKRPKRRPIHEIDIDDDAINEDDIWSETWRRQYTLEQKASTLG